jgi:fucose 4-O-acetylase-like acetyltransferase
VVFVHTRNGLTNSGLLRDAGTFVTYSRTLTLSAMPLFFFLSGMFVRSTLRRGLRGFVGNELRTIAYPYFLWSTIYLVAAVLFADQVYHRLTFEDLWRITHEPIVHFWFFYSLFSIRMFYAILTKAGMGPKAILVLSVGIYLTSFTPLPQSVWFAIRTLPDVYLPCFALGALINRGEPTISLSNARPRTLALLIAGGLALALLVVAVGWTDRPTPRLTAVLPGAVALMSLAVVMERHSWLRAFSYLGRHSMPIYVAHPFGLTAMRIFLRGIGVLNPWIHLALGIGAGVVGALVVERLASAAGVKHLYTLRGLRLRRTEADGAGPGSTAGVRAGSIDG